MKLIKLIISICLLQSCSQLEGYFLANNKSTQNEVTEKLPLKSDATKAAAIQNSNEEQKTEDQSPEIENTKHKANLKPELEKYCKKIDKFFKTLNWPNSNCENQAWHHVRNSVNGDPLVWLEYDAQPTAEQHSKNTTLILCGVHGDEITPIKFCFDIIDEINSKKLSLSDNSHVIIAPIANPDSFFISRPTRTNARGVDINRNFPTKDWYKHALKTWKQRYLSDKRKFPGNKPMSEPEVLFQVNLINRYNPDKIITVHSPLTLLDYDGPIFGNRNSSIEGEKAKNLLISMSEMASGYKISDYPFFPGSLGNYAGNEKQIPTYTLELPDSNSKNSAKFWERFKNSVHFAIEQDFRKQKITDATPEQ